MSIFDHGHHGFHGMSGAVGVRIFKQLTEALRYDLPGKAPAVGDPAALDFLAAVQAFTITRKPP